jgi:pimeloyl-ACP methyl ester carboxylesterase
MMRAPLKNLTKTVVANLTSPLFTFQTWQWQGHQIRYTIMGEGPPLVLLHGFGASIGHWRKNIPVLAAGGYQVFALDLLGFGGSDKPLLDYSMALWAELLKDFWTAKIGRPAVYIGNSIGGLLALLMLAEHPETARGGILLNPAGGLSHRPDELNLPLRVILGSFAKLAGSDLIGKFLFNQVRRKPRIRASLAQVYCNPEAITDDLVELLYAPSCDPGAQQVFAKVIGAPAGPRPEELLPQVQAPLLVLWGEADPWTPIGGASVYQSQPSPEITVIPIPQTGHCPHDENPNAVNPAILDWLRRQPV